MVRKDKRDTWRDELEVDSSPRNAWKVARKVLGQQSSTSPNSLINKQGQTVTNPLLMAEVLSDHFASKVNTLRQTRRLVPVVNPRDRLKEYLEARFPSSQQDLESSQQGGEGEGESTTHARHPSGVSVSICKSMGQQ